MHMSSFLHKACVQYIAENIDLSNNSNDELEEVLRADTFTSCVISFLKSNEQQVVPPPITPANNSF